MLKTLRRYPLCLAGLFGIVAVSRAITPVNATTAALYFLLVVLGAATRWGFAESIFTSVAGMMVFNYYFLPPVGTFVVSDPENWVALFAFLATASIASKLSSSAKSREVDALERRN